MYMYIYMCVCVYMCVYIYIYIYIYVYVYMYVCMYIYMYIMYVCICLYIHIPILHFMNTMKIHKHVWYRYLRYNFLLVSILKMQKNIILYLDYVLFIWRKLDGCIYVHLSYCKAKLK